LERDFSTYPNFMDGNISSPCNMDINEMYKDPLLNPMMQYEQAFCYYRYLCIQMDYKMKCKEYEKMCENSIPRTQSSNERRERRIE